MQQIHVRVSKVYMNISIGTGSSSIQNKNVELYPLQSLVTGHCSLHEGAPPYHCTQGGNPS